MGFNKKIVGKKTIEQINDSLDNIELYLKADLILFESKEVNEKFQKLRDEFIQKNTIV